MICSESILSRSVLSMPDLPPNPGDFIHRVSIRTFHARYLAVHFSKRVLFVF